MPTNGFSTKPLKVKLLAGEQKATEHLFYGKHRLVRQSGSQCSFSFSPWGVGPICRWLQLREAQKWVGARGTYTNPQVSTSSRSSLPATIMDSGSRHILEDCLPFGGPPCPLHCWKEGSALNEVA